MTFSSADPETPGFDPERLGRVGAAIDRDIGQGRYDGAAIAVGRHGSLATPRTFGGIGAGSAAFFIAPERDLFYAFLSTGLVEESRSMERHQRLADLVHASIVE